MQSIRSYDEAAKEILRARNKQAGRPLGGYGGRVRLFQEGDQFVIRDHRAGVADVSVRIYPDNTALITVPTLAGRAYPRTALYSWIALKVIGLDLRRRDRRVYSVWPEDKIPLTEYKSKYSGYTWMVRDWDAIDPPDLVNGLRYDLTSQTFINPAKLSVVKTELARAWRAKVTAYRKAWTIAARVGAVDAQVKHWIELPPRERDAMQTACRGANRAELLKSAIENCDLSPDAIRLWLFQGWMWPGTPTLRTVAWQTELFGHVYRQFRNEIQELAGVRSIAPQPVGSGGERQAA